MVAYMKLHKEIERGFRRIWRLREILNFKIEFHNLKKYHPLEWKNTEDIEI